MYEIKRINDTDILEQNALRKVPCITEGGECCIVTSVRIFDDGERFEVIGGSDVNVFATEREAREWVAKMMAGKRDADLAIKHAYTMRCHQVRL